LKTNAHFHWLAQNLAVKSESSTQREIKASSLLRNAIYEVLPLPVFYFFELPFVLSAITPLILSFDSGKRPGHAIYATTTSPESGRSEISFSAVVKNFWH
jgi:hypothetical protein